MKLGYLPSMADNVRTMRVFVKSIGSSSLTETEEQAILDNYKPKLVYKDLVFSGKYKVDAQGDVVADASAGETVTLSLINKVIEINKDFVAEFTIATKDVKASELGTIFATADKLAEAKCILFRDVVTKAVEDIVTAIKAKEDDFEKENESEEF
jgi:hypothetical protein